MRPVVSVHPTPRAGAGNRRAAPGCGSRLLRAPVAVAPRRPRVCLLATLLRPATWPAEGGPARALSSGAGPAGQGPDRKRVGKEKGGADRDNVGGGVRNKK